MTNFDEIIQRRQSNSYKWDSRKDIPSDTIPLWVADMDFRACQPIIDALRRRVDHGVFGYTFVPDGYYRAIDCWFSKWHGWSIPQQQVIYTSGVVPAISAIIKALTSKGDKVILQTPVYNCFFSSIANNDCQVAAAPLCLDEKSGKYHMDFESLEAMASLPDCKLMLLCNPHNPVGRVWTRAELERVADICSRHDVIVVSDEIHCEITFGEDNDYLPFALVAGDCKWVSCVSPSKAFNIAGLQIANIVCPDEHLRRKINKAININEVCDVNPFGVDALIAAYSDAGHSWLEEMRRYVHTNFVALREAFTAELPFANVIDSEGTYLAWVDLRALGISSDELEEILIQKAHVWINAGVMYGADGEGFMRINLACPHAVFDEALRRMVPVLASLYENR